MFGLVFMRLNRRGSSFTRSASASSHDLITIVSVLVVNRVQMVGVVGVDFGGGGVRANYFVHRLGEFVFLPLFGPVTL